MDRKVVLLWRKLRWSRGKWIGRSNCSMEVVKVERGWKGGKVTNSRCGGGVNQGRGRRRRRETAD